MSEPWLDQHINDLRYGTLFGQERIEALRDLIVNDTIPPDLAHEVLAAIGDGYLTPAGDVLGWPTPEEDRSGPEPGSTVRGSVP